MILIDIGEAEDKEYTAGMYMNEQGKSLMYPPVRGGRTSLKEANGDVPLNGVAERQIPSENSPRYPSPQNVSTRGNSKEV